MNSAEPPTNGSVSDSRPPVYPPSEVVVDRKISTETGLKSPLPGVTRTLSLGLNKSLKVTFAPPVLPGGSPPSENYMNLVGKAWQRKVLQDLTEQTHFSSTELQVLLNHFTDLQSSDDHLDKDTFFKCLGQAFGTTERELLVHIYGAMDEHDRGYVSFKQFVCALSTVFRGDKDDILEFWFRMYDSDHDGLLTKKDFEELLMDVNTATRKAVAVYVEQLFGNEGEGIDEEVAPVLDEELGDSQEEVLISFEEFRTIMEEYDVIPIFVNPHKFAQHKQAPAFRNMAPAEREVTLLLGTELRPVQGHMLIEENAKCDHFFFVLEGEVSMERGGVHLGTITDGQFLVNDNRTVSQM